MVSGSRTSVHDIVDRILLELAQKQYRHLRNVWQKNSQTEICYFVGGGSIVLKDYLKTLKSKFMMAIILIFLKMKKKAFG